MTTAEDLAALIERDTDEVLTQARSLDCRRGFRLMRAAAEHYGSVANSAKRLKIVWTLQALLAATEDRRLTIQTSLDVATLLSRITRSRDENLEVRRGALDSLALVFRKTKTLTLHLDTLIRGAFVSASNSNDPYMSEFAAEALSGEGLLASRRPSGVVNRILPPRQGVVKIAGHLAGRVKSAVRRLPLGMMTGKRASAKKQVAKRSSATPRRPAKHL